MQVKEVGSPSPFNGSRLQTQVKEGSIPCSRAQSKAGNASKSLWHYTAQGGPTSVLGQASQVSRLPLSLPSSRWGGQSFYSQRRMRGGDGQGSRVLGTLDTAVGLVHGPWGLRARDLGPSRQPRSYVHLGNQLALEIQTSEPNLNLCGFCSLGVFPSSAATSSRNGNGARVLNPLCTRPHAEHPHAAHHSVLPEILGRGLHCLKQLSLLFSGGKLTYIIFKSLTIKEIKNR